MKISMSKYINARPLTEREKKLIYMMLLSLIAGAAFLLISPVLVRYRDAKELYTLVSGREISERQLINGTRENESRLAVLNDEINGYIQDGYLEYLKEAEDIEQDIKDELEYLHLGMTSIRIEEQKQSGNKNAQTLLKKYNVLLNFEGLSSNCREFLHYLNSIKSYRVKNIKFSSNYNIAGDEEYVYGNFQFEAVVCPEGDTDGVVDKDSERNVAEGASEGAVEGVAEQGSVTETVVGP